MTSRILRSSFIAAVVIAAMPLAADVPGRVHPVKPLALVTISGVVRDSVTGAPIAVAVVHSGSAFYDRNNGTKADGAYTLTVPSGRPVLITAEQFSYEPQTKTPIATAGMTLDFSLTPRATATVKLTNGVTHVLGLSSSSFAYAIPFSGYARFDNANFCKTDGSDPKTYGLNSVGMRRSGFSRERLLALEKAYRLLIKSGLNTTQALERIGEELGGNPDVDDLVDFIRKSKRSFHR